MACGLLKLAEHIFTRLQVDFLIAILAGKTAVHVLFILLVFQRAFDDFEALFATYTDGFIVNHSHTPSFLLG